MARPKKQQPAQPKVPDEVPPGHALSVAEAAADAKLLAIADRYACDLGMVNQQFGQLQLARGLVKFFRAAEIKLLQEIRDSQLFNGIAIKDGDVFRPAKNFADLCEVGLGMPASKVYEDIQDLETLGDAYEDFKRLGLDRKHFRALRKLPDDTREALIAGTTVDLSDPDEVKAVIEEQAAKLAEADQTLAAKDAVIKKKDEKINDLDEKLHKKEFISKPWDYRVAEINEELNTIACVCEEAIEKLWIIKEAILNADFEDDVRDRAKAALARHYSDRAARLVERVALIQHACNEELIHYHDEPRHQLRLDETND